MSDTICYLDILPYELLGIVSDFLNKKGNRRFRQAYRRFEKIFYEHYTLNTMTILKEDIKSKDLSLFSEYRALHIKSEINERDLLLLENCRKLTLEDTKIMGMFLCELPLTYLDVDDVVDCELLEDMNFEYLKLCIQDVDELKYLRCNELDFTIKGSSLLDFSGRTITQELIDAMRCKSLNVNSSCCLKDLTIDKICISNVMGTVVRNISVKELILNSFGSVNIEFQNDSFEFNDTYAATIDEINDSVLESLTIKLACLTKIQLDRFKNLKSLHLTKVDIDPESLRDLNLNEITLAGNDQLTDEHTLIFSECNYINFNNTNITGIHLGFFQCTILGLNNCENFDPKHIENNVYVELSLDDVMGIAETIEIIPYSKSISLKYRKDIDDEMLKQLSESYKIDIIGCNINGEGLQYLSNCRELHTDYANLIPDYLEDLTNCDYIYLENSYSNFKVESNIIADIEISNSCTFEENQNSTQSVKNITSSICGLNIAGGDPDVVESITEKYFNMIEENAPTRRVMGGFMQEMMEEINMDDEQSTMIQGLMNNFIDLQSYLQDS